MTAFKKPETSEEFFDILAHAATLMSSPEFEDVRENFLPREDMFAYFLNVPEIHKLCAGLLLQMPLDDKHLAVDVAEELGPDNAQALYRFAVLVTKLA